MFILKNNQKTVKIEVHLKKVFFLMFFMCYKFQFLIVRPNRDRVVSFVIDVHLTTWQSRFRLNPSRLYMLGAILGLKFCTEINILILIIFVLFLLFLN